MNISTTKLQAFRRRGLATALVSLALLAVSSTATLGLGNAATAVACQGGGWCGG
jgi:hypothetical protein